MTAHATAIRAQTLIVAGTPVADYCDGTAMDPGHSPRPHLHPVRTLDGVEMTEAEPVDHRHHYGMSNAIADVDSSNYWGGPSYMDSRGYQMLPDQGRQQVLYTHATTTTIEQQVQWLDAGGTHHLSEQRHLRAMHLPQAQGWALHWHSVLHADATAIALGSPATRGRVGAGYGGLFWRLSDISWPTTVTVVDGGGTKRALGSRSPWLLVQQEREQGTVSLLLVQPAPMLPWFVRTQGYVGAGPAVAWRDQRHLGFGQHYRMSLAAVLADRAITPEEAAVLAADQISILQEDM